MKRMKTEKFFLSTSFRPGFFFIKTRSNKEKCDKTNDDDQTFSDSSITNGRDF